MQYITEVPQTSHARKNTNLSTFSVSLSLSNTFNSIATKKKLSNVIAHSENFIAPTIKILAGITALQRAPLKPKHSQARSPRASKKLRETRAAGKNRIQRAPRDSPGIALNAPPPPAPAARTWGFPRALALTTIYAPAAEGAAER